MGAHEAIGTKGSSKVLGARTGEQFLAGLKARPRDLWLGNEKIDDVTAHPHLPVAHGPWPSCSTCSTSSPMIA